MNLGLKPEREFGELIKLSEQLRDDQDVSRQELLELLTNVRSFEEVKQRINSRLL